MSKTYPSHWGTREIAFFAGIVCGSIRTGDLKQMADECIAASPNKVLYFPELLQRAEPQIRADRWNGCVENCEKFFGRKHAENSEAVNG